MAALVGVTAASASIVFNRLHHRIDRLIEADFPGPIMPPASDADFVRRIHLDLTGRIPTADEARAFLADTKPDKREGLIVQLLTSPALARHLATSFDVMLMERRPEKNVTIIAWQQYLFDSFATNKPFNQLAREILAADGADEATRPAARFMLDREGEANLLTRDVGRLFFGMDLQCAQCHDHPRIADYLQRDYHGLYAFLNRTYLFTTDRSKKSYLAEKADGDVAFTSVFTKQAGDTLPRLPGGASVPEPRFPRGAEYLVKPDAKDKNLRPVPKYSRREQLARVATDGTNRAFNRNIVNRLWALMFGRGLVEPVDELHSDNPAAYPPLLDMLADEFVKMKYDTRLFLGELARTHAYQRSIEVPAWLTLHDRSVEVGKLKLDPLVALAAEQMHLTNHVAAAEAALLRAQTNLAATRKEMEPLLAELAKTNTAIAEVKKACDPALAANDAAEKQLATQRDALKSVLEAAAKIDQTLDRLTDDKDLQATLDKLRARAALLTNEVTSATTNLAAKAAAAKPMAEKLAAVETTAAPLLARLDIGNLGLLGREQELTVATSRLHEAKASAKHIAQRLAEAKALTEYEGLLATARASRTAVGQLEAMLAAARLIVTKHDELVAAQKAGEALESAWMEAAKQLAERSVKQPGTQANADTFELQQIVAGREAEAKAARMRVADARRSFDKVARQFAAAQADIPLLESKTKSARAQAAADFAKLSEPLGKLSTTLEKSFAAGVFTGLTPEQLGWSMMQATGITRQQAAAAEAEFDKKNPPTDAARASERAKFVEQYVWDKLKGNIGTFVSLFGNVAGQPQDVFYATADQALFFNNGGTVRGWLAPSSGNLGDRLNKTADAAAMADELYLSVLTRRPTDAEISEVEKRLAARPTEKLAVAQELAWALLTSVEFRFKH